MRALVVLLVLMTAACSIDHCKQGTVFISYTLVGGAEAADTIDVMLTIADGSAQTKSVARKSGDASIEVDFGRYPKGQSLAFTLIARAGSEVLASASQTSLAMPGCTAMSFKLDGSMNDLGSADLLLGDGGDDLMTAADLSPLVCQPMCLPSESCCAANACRNLTNDPMNCGQCNRVCPTGENCAQSACSCAGGPTCAGNYVCSGDAGCQCSGTISSCSTSCCLTIRGIDVSQFQGTVTWSQVKSAGMTFAIAKATQGTTITDTTFATNWGAMKSAGLIRGAYHYFDASQDGTAQANLFVSVVNSAGLTPSDFLMIDFEQLPSGTSASTALAALQTMLSAVQSQTGHLPGLYTTNVFWNSLSAGNGFAGYPMWIANYGVSCPTLPQGGWTDWTFWQDSGTATVSGITGQVDTNSFNGTMADLQGFLTNQSTGAQTSLALCGHK